MSNWMNELPNLRAFHMLLEMLLKKQSEVAFCNESCSKVARKDENFFWSDAKICKLYNKSKISKHFCAILRRNQRC